MYLKQQTSLLPLLYYFFVFLASLIVDVIPLIGPPAWTVMVLFHLKFDLNIWWVLVFGVTGSAIGRYIYSRYVHLLSQRFIKKEKNEDLHFIGKWLATNGWKIQLFVLVYTLMPLPSTPLFTAAGVSRIKTIKLIPMFFIGKFISDGLMVFTGNYIATNATLLAKGFFSWQTVVGMVISIVIVGLFIFTDWRILFQQKKWRLSFQIWK